MPHTNTDLVLAIDQGTTGTTALLLDPRVRVILDVKTPDSGMSARQDLGNLDRLRPHDEVKFVIGDREDYEWSCGVVREHDLPSRCKAVLFAPVFDVMAPHTLCEWILDDGIEVRFQLPLHKYVWPPGRRGV